MAAKLGFREVFLKERETLIKEIREEQVQRVAEIPEEALIWLALVPAWNLPLAKACDFPTGGNALEETLRQIKEAGYYDSNPTLPVLDETDAEMLPGPDLESFWMPNSMRAEILQRVIHDTGRGLPYLQQTIKLISEKLQSAESSGLLLPDSVRRWATLASMSQSTSQLANWLDQKRDELLQGNEPGELLRWIEVARPLEELLGNELTTTLRRAARLLELYHRLADDKRRVAKFLARDEQIKAFDDLIQDPSKGWALHYIGSGGMGKTMFMRYLTAELALKLGASTGRVDFDYLNPDYPAHAPGLLLAQLAEELRVHDLTGTATSSFALFIEKVSNLHERLGATSLGTQFSLASVMAPIYDQLPLFVDALNLLPKPIIIILDTCEELAKIRIDGTTPPSVQATFEILERLHQMQPDLRVVFGGRRPLASVGAGWTCPSSQLPPRPYLRAHEIRGFTFEEATKYLAEIEKVPSQAVLPIIKHSLIKNDVTSRLAWKGLGPPAGKVDRYHPFDLSLYAAWIHEDPNLPVSALESADADRYIDMRIVRRMRHPILRNLLPAVALLGRFDFNTLRSISGTDAAPFTDVFIELSNQEWINRQSSNFLEVDQGLQPRLLAYYQRTKQSETEKMRRALVDYLEKVTIDEDRSLLDVSHFRAAFRLLKPEPKRAADWWARIEIRFAEEQAYDWLRNVCEIILGDEEIEQGSGSPLKPSEESKGTDLHAAVRASYAAALTHIGPFDKLEATWAEVLLYADRHPVPDGVDRLVARARAGQLAAAARYKAQGPKDEEVEWLRAQLNQVSSTSLDTQLTASFIAATEAMVEFTESRNRKHFLDPAPLIHFSSILSELGGNQELACFASSLTGRLLALSGNWAEADAWFYRSILLPQKRLTSKPTRRKTKSQPATAPARAIDTEQLTAQTWLDWSAPDQLWARMRLEFIRSMYPTHSSAEVLDVVGDSIHEPGTIDTDRLGSAILQLRAATGPLFTKDSEDLARKSRYLVQHQPLCNAHRSFPPLFAIVAEATAARGRVDEAVEKLSSQSAAAENVNLATVMEADRACLRIARRMRLRDENIGASTSVHSSVDFQDVALIWQIEGLSNPKKNAPLGIDSLLERATDPQHYLCLLHDRFRTSYTLRPEMANSLIKWASQFIQPAERLSPDATFAELSCFLDCLETNEISRWQGVNRPYPKIRLGQIKKTKLWQDKHSPPLERLKIQLRHAGLDASPSTILRIDQILVETVGYRRAAKVALDEGELLALRFPNHAARLLNQAHRWYTKANDYLGASIAKICMALALVQSGQNAGLSRALKRIEKDFVASENKLLTDLPKWDTVKNLAEHPQARSLDALDPRGWRPWLIRLIACLAWQKDGYHSGDRSQLLARWIATNYGVTSESETILPAELDGWLTGETRISPASRAKAFLAITLARRSIVWQSLERTTQVFLALQGEDKQARERVDVMGLDPYRIAAHDLVGQLYAPDSQLQPEVLASLGSQDVIMLKVDHASSWPCWEAIIAYALQETGRSAEHQLGFQRTVSESKIRRTLYWNKVKEVLTWTNDLHAAEVARYGWNSISDVGSVEINDSESINFRHYNRKAQVLHVIGAPTETSSGVRLDLSATRLWRQETKGGGSSAFPGGGSMDPYPNARGTSSGASGKIGSGKGDLVKADNLFSLLPNMALCILQAPPRPVDGHGARTGSDREQAAYLRIMGAELFRLGVPVVITIPALFLEIAPAVLERIARTLQDFQGKPPDDPFLLRTWPSKSPAPAKRWNTTRAVTAFVSAIQQSQALIRESALMNQEDAAETAFDLCLYAPM